MEQKPYIVMADLSLFAFEALLNYEILAGQWSNPELDVTIEIPG